MRAGPRRRARHGTLAGAAALALVSLLAMAACDASSSSTAPGVTSAAVETDANGSSLPGDDTASPGQITIDPSLLAILPREVDSVPVIESEDGDSDALADDVLPTIATSAVAAIAIDSQAQEFAYALVVRLKPGAFNDAIYRSWRDSYDAGACQTESQVVGNASATVKGNTVYIGTCANAVTTYHVWLESKGILISVSSGGEKHLGLALLGNLRG